MSGTTPTEMEVLQKALADHGIAWKQFMEHQTETLAELKDRVKDIEQKASRGFGVLSDDEHRGDTVGELTQLLTKSDHYKAFEKKHVPTTAFEVPSNLLRTKAVITSSTATPGTMRMPGVIATPQQRVWVRDLLPTIQITTGSIETLKETTFTNNAGPQYDATSPTPGQEGAIKNESGLTFELVTASPTTIAHHITASRQVLSDIPQLRGHIDRRLLYGLELETDDEILNGVGTNGTMNGLKNQDTAFTGASTNVSQLDVLARGIVQLVVNNYMPSGVILHPADWWNILQLKDAEGRYLFGDPHTMIDPRIWSIPVAATTAQTQGEFTVLDGARAGYLAVREEANIRFSEHHADNFVRNLVTILAELRAVLVVEQSAAIVSGSLSYLG